MGGGIEMFISRYIKFISRDGVFAWWRFNEFAD
jgi:hypothetical protein